MQCIVIAELVIDVFLLSGEFTLRAFLNGRLDLSQAENVERLIAAKSAAAADSALAGIQACDVVMCNSTFFSSYVLQLCIVFQCCVMAFLLLFTAERSLSSLTGWFLFSR